MLFQYENPDAIFLRNRHKSRNMVYNSFLRDRAPSTFFDNSQTTSIPARRDDGSQRKASPRRGFAQGPGSNIEDGRRDFLIIYPDSSRLSRSNRPKVRHSVVAEPIPRLVSESIRLKCRKGSQSRRAERSQFFEGNPIKIKSCDDKPSGAERCRSSLENG